MFDSFLRPLFLSLPPETAHAAALHAVQAAAPMLALPPFRTRHAPQLAQHVWGLHFPSPIGLAAGFDKHAQAVDGLLRIGFGFVEAGTVTRLPQPGNAQPRIFRLKRDRGVINRMGFNSVGVEMFMRNLARQRADGVVGVNIGRNRESEDVVEEYCQLLERVAPLASYVTINISSPNTQGIRALQQKRPLEQLVESLVTQRDAISARLSRRIPLLVKIAPDLEAHELEDVVEVCLRGKIDGLIVSNTTIKRPATLQSRARAEQGGLSGAPLFEMSTQMLRRVYQLSGGLMPLIGVGGISNAEQAYAKIQAGASLVQLYTGLIFQGVGLVRKIEAALPQLLARDGFSLLSQAVGSKAS